MLRCVALLGVKDGIIMENGSLFLMHQNLWCTTSPCCLFAVLWFDWLDGSERFFVTWIAFTRAIEMAFQGIFENPRKWPMHSRRAQKYQDITTITFLLFHPTSMIHDTTACKQLNERECTDMIDCFSSEGLIPFYISFAVLEKTLITSTWQSVIREFFELLVL